MKADSQIDWLEFRKAGWYCIPGNFFLDPLETVGTAVISHAHGDHYPRFLSEVHATTATIDIARSRWRNMAGRKITSHEYGQSFSIGPVEIKLLPSGHILGSAQIWMQYKGSSVLFSGDIMLAHNPTCIPLEYPSGPPDWLICESTFGEKESHPQPEDEIRRAIEGLRRPLLIGVYPIGKAQRVNELLTRLYPEVPVFAHHEILRGHKIYAEHGLPTGTANPYRRTEAKRITGPWVWLVPPRILTSFADDERFVRMLASGWTPQAKHWWVDGQLDISDHASSSELMTYVQRVNPRKVFFWHGYATALVKACEAEGISAEIAKPV